MRYKVWISPSIFRDHESFELGQYESKWRAWLAAWWHVTWHPHAEATVYERKA